MKKMESLSSFRNSLDEKQLASLKGGLIASVGVALGDKTKEKTKSKDADGRTVDKCTSQD